MQTNKAYNFTVTYIMFHELCNIRQAEQIGGGGGGGGGGGLNLLGDEFNLKHEIVVVKEISHKSNLLTTNKQTKQTNTLLYAQITYVTYMQI